MNSEYQTPPHPDPLPDPLAWFCELLSGWSKKLFGSQDLVSGHKVKKSVLTHTPMLGLLLENCSVELHKIKRQFQLIEI